MESLRKAPNNRTEQVRSPKGTEPINGAVLEILFWKSLNITKLWFGSGDFHISDPLRTMLTPSF